MDKSFGETDAGTEREQIDQIRSIVDGLPEGYELYAAVGALTSIAAVLDWEASESL